MRIAFFGTSEFALPALQALVNNNTAPIAVITAPDKPKGRGQHVRHPQIKQWLVTSDQRVGKAKNIQVFQPENLDSDFVLQISNLKPDVGIVAAYGKILPKALIELFPRSALNIHPSLLPQYRGPSPIQTTLLNGDKEMGVTIITIDEKMDHGPIVAQQQLGGGYRIPPDITYPALHNTLAELGAQLLIETLPKWIAGDITPTPQDDTKATYTKLLKKEDGKINWSKSAEEIERMVRAYNPWPGSFSEIKNQKSPASPSEAGRTKIKNILKIKKAEVLKEMAASPLPPIPGTFFKTTNGFPAVICGKSALKLLVVQPEGKNEMPGDAFARGYMK